VKSSLFCAAPATIPVEHFAAKYFRKRTSQKSEIRMDSMKGMKKKSDGYYDKAWRWIEDTYLKYFGENRTSYGVKGTFHP
jgi:hypothetical protein